MHIYLHIFPTSIVPSTRVNNGRLITLYKLGYLAGRPPDGGAWHEAGGGVIGLAFRPAAFWNAASLS